MKPLICFEKFIKLCSNENDVVLDPFIGSGTCAIACLRNNRRFIGIELNPDFVALSERRIKDDQCQVKTWTW